MSCSAHAKNYSPKITVSSSDAVPDAVYLTNRLGTLTDNVYLGIGSDEFDMTDFENDGYIIRADDGDAVIVGKTPEGLTTGVRKYANYAEKNQASALDISYHEGYRIDKLTLGGVDISEYAIEYPETYNENMTFAADELARLIEKACGIKLPVSEGITDRKYAVEFRHSHDTSLKNNGYRYFFEGNRLVIEGAVARGCMYGVWRFLVKELEWTGLVYWDSGKGLPDSILAENEHLDVPLSAKREETPAFDYITPTQKLDFSRKSDITPPTSAQKSYGPYKQSLHGQQSMDWGKFKENGDVDYQFEQICYSDEGNLERVTDHIREYLDGKISAGAVIGQDINMIDLSHADNFNFCRCNKCLDSIRKEKSIAGSILSFVNRVEEEIDPDYPGLTYWLFAYQGTQPPPEKTVPNDNVYITFCTDHCCSAHSLTDVNCVDFLDVVGVGNKYHNSDFAKWLRGWGELTENVYIWYYSLDLAMMQYTILDVLYEDMKLFYECGFKGIYYENGTHEVGMNRIADALLNEMNWNPDMSYEEYMRSRDEILVSEYGDGSEYVGEYLDLWQASQNAQGKCWSCWYFGDEINIDQFSMEYVYGRFDRMVGLLERAVELACDEREIRNCKILTAHMYYEGCISSYFREYDRGNTQRLEELSRYYDRMYDNMVSSGINMKKLGQSRVFSINKTLEEEAWTKWVQFRKKLPCGETVRPAPDAK